MGSDHRTYCFAAALFCSLISQCKGTNPLLYSLSIFVSVSPWDKQNSEGWDEKGREMKGNGGERRRPNRISDSRERWIKIQTEGSLGIYLLVLWLFFFALKPLFSFCPVGEAPFSKFILFVCPSLAFYWINPIFTVQYIFYGKILTCRWVTVSTMNFIYLYLCNSQHHVSNTHRVARSQLDFLGLCPTQCYIFKSKIVCS